MDDFFMYVESCEATGVPVNRFNPMYILGAAYATGEIVKGVKMILIRDSIVNDAVLGSLYVGGIKVCETLENKAKLIPCAEYNLNVSKSQKFERLLPLVYNDEVSMRRGIRIHAGNSVKDASQILFSPVRIAFLVFCTILRLSRYFVFGMYSVTSTKGPNIAIALSPNSLPRSSLR